MLEIWRLIHLKLISHLQDTQDLVRGLGHAHERKGFLICRMHKILCKALAMHKKGRDFLSAGRTRSCARPRPYRPARQLLCCHLVLCGLALALSQAVIDGSRVRV